MHKWSRIYQWSFIITAALIPSGIYEMTLAFVALSGLCWLVQKRYAEIKMLPTAPQFLFSVLLYVYVFICSFFSTNHSDALSSLSVYFPLLFFPLFIGQSGIITSDLIRKIETVFLYSTLLALMIMLGYALADSLITGVRTVKLSDAEYNKFSSYGLTRVYGNFHPTHFAMFVNHSIFILFRLIAENYKQKEKLITGSYLVMLILLSVSLLLLNSMMGVLVFFLMIFYISNVLLSRTGFPVSKRVLIVTGLVAASTAFIYFNPLDIYKIDTLKNRKLRPTDNYVERNLLTIRLAKWETHLKIINEHFLCGTTEGDIRQIRKEAYLEKGYNDLAIHNYNAHNQYLEIFTTMGLIGFILFACMLISAFLKKRSRSFYLFMLIVLVTWLTESTLEMQQGFNYMMFFFALYTAPELTNLSAPRRNGNAG